MEVLWCGSEDIHFLTFTGCDVTTGSSYFRSSYSRCAINIISESAAAKSTTFPGGAITSGWLTFQAQCDAWQPNSRPCGFGQSSTAKSGLYVGTSSSSGSKVALIKYDGTTAIILASESGNSLVGGSQYKIDLEVINYGATATVNVYINQNLVITYTGNVAVSGVTNLDSVFLSTRAGSDIRVSEIIVADEDTRTMSLRTRYPTADGTTHDMTGAYSDVDEITINDADVIYTNTADKDQQCEISDLPAGTFAVLATKIAVRACKSEDASIDKIKLGYLSDGTVAVGSAQSLTTSWDTYEEIFATNPVTLSAWLQSEQNALQVNVRSAA